MNRVSLGLRGDHGLLEPAQKLPGFSQCQTEICDIPEVAELTKVENIQASLRPVGARVHQPHNPDHPKAPNRP